MSTEAWDLQIVEDKDGDDTDAIAIAAGSGGSFAIAVRSTGQVTAWGLNAKAQLGTGTLVTASTPVTVATIASAR